MKRTPTTLFLAYALVLSSVGPVARAQSTLSTETKAKTEVVDRLNKKETRVKVKLRNGSEVKGRITQTGENSFTLTDEKTGSHSDIVYADVLNVEGRGMSKKKKTFIAIGVGAAVFAALVAYALTHFWED
jgi:small nuclear ribonucleoprotein (snRNP)-like protein